MITSVFQPATKKKSRLRMALCGPTGSGKTFTALRTAFAFRGAETRVAVINTESGAIEKYLGLAPDGIPFQFDILTLEEYPPTAYTDAIMAAGRAGYDVVIIDSLTHAWTGVGGALEIKDKTDGNSFTAWKNVTPMHNRMIEAILRSPCHIIVTMRSHMEYVLQEQGGKMVPQRVGMAPVQRKGMEYEFDVVADMDLNHMISVGKSRCPAIDGVQTIKPGLAFMQPLVEWLLEGVEVDPSYYAVTDEDLRILERKEHQNLSTAEKLAQSRAAQAAAAAALRPAGPALCTEQLERQIREVLPQSGISREQLEARFAQLGISKIRELTQDQAENLYHKLLQRKSERMQADAANQLAASGAPVDTGEAIPKASPAAPVADQQPKCDEKMEADIRALLPQAKIMPAKFGEMLARFGVTKIRELTWRDAAEIVDQLRVKVQGNGQADVPFEAGAANAPVSNEQLERIKSLVNRTGWPHERQLAYLRDRGFSSFRSLSATQADELIEKLLKVELGFAGAAPAGKN